MISIIIPTLDEEKIIEKTLKNLAEYTGPHEIIVSDGKSTDQTVAIARRYTNKIALDHDSARQTIAGGRNAGAALATGDFLLFLDADVTIPNPDEFFAKALKLFAADEKLVAIAPFIRVLPEMETFFDRLVFWCFGYYLLFFNNFCGIGMAAGEFQMMRTQKYRQLGGYNHQYVAGEDFEFFRRLSLVGKTRVIRDLTVYHTGRRPHSVGWPKLLSIWAINSLSVTLFKKSYSKEWKEIR